MRIFVDTSALHALLDDDDLRRADVAEAFVELRGRRLLTHSDSLVDFTSFEVMRRLEIRTALSVDRDFANAGFEVIPA